MTLEHSHSDQKLEGVTPKHRSIRVALAPNVVLVVTKNNNARLCMKGKKVFVTFNGEYTHS